MTNTRKFVIILAVIGLVVLTGLVTSAYYTRLHQSDTAFRAITENKLLEYGKALARSKAESKAKSSEIEQKEARIKELEALPPLIIYQNDQTHIDIDRLNAYNSILRFTDNAAKYHDNIGRYRLRRFAVKNP